MQQQPLAFTLVKTVVSARDEGKVLSPALATAWDLLRTELSPAHRVIASEVSWSPTHQEDLKFVIEGVRKQFEKDAELENEFLAFLAEVEPFGKEEKEANILPILGGVATASDISPMIGEISFEVEAQEISINQSSILEPNQSKDEVLEHEISSETPLGEQIESEGEVLEHENLSETSNQEQIEPETSEPTVESLDNERIEHTANLENDPNDQATEQLETTTQHFSESLSGNLAQKKIALPTTTSTPSSALSLASYWPLAAGVLLVALTTFGLWTFSSPNETTALPEVIDSQIILKDSISDQSSEVEAVVNSVVEYSTLSTARLSQTVDSLRQRGDYQAALSKQIELAQLLEEEGSPDEETVQAYSELAILYATQNNFLQAVVEQRKSLAFARQAFAKTDPALGRSHLKLASFYSDTGELHMARAHLQQARKIFGQAQELIAPTDLENSEEVAEKILNAS